MAAYALPTNAMPPRIAQCYQSAKVITPTDNTAIGPFSALWIGETCDVTVVMRNGSGDGNLTPVTFQAVPAGTLLEIAVQGVNATGTTAAGANAIIGLA